jgi:hypothetical protein
MSLDCESACRCGWDAMLCTAFNEFASEHVYRTFRRFGLGLLLNPFQLSANLKRQSSRDPSSFRPSEMLSPRAWIAKIRGCKKRFVF